MEIRALSRFFYSMAPVVRFSLGEKFPNRPHSKINDLSLSEPDLATRNSPFPSSLVPLFQNESKCEIFHMKMSSACSFIFMQIKVIFIRMVSHLQSNLY